MTPQEAAIVTAYTEILIGDFGEFHKYAEQKLGRPVWTHEFASADVWAALKEATKPDFMAIVVEPPDPHSGPTTAQHGPETLRSESGGVSGDVALRLLAKIAADDEGYVCVGAKDMRLDLWVDLADDEAALMASLALDHPHNRDGA